jgi:hypothetical protein
MIGRRILLPALLLLALAPPARAERGADADKTARAAFEEAEAAFRSGGFGAALAAYQRAYEAKHLPGFLFNIAQCHRHLGNHERAVQLYRRYLSADPATANRAVVEDLIAEEQRRMDPAPAARPAATAPPPLALAPPPAASAPSPPPPAAAAPPSPSPEPPVAAAPPPDDPPLFVAAPHRSDPPSPAPVYQRWWFWTAIGGAVAAGVATAFVLKPTSGGSPPHAALPPIDWR